MVGRENVYFVIFEDRPIHSRRDGDYSVRERLQQPAIGLPQQSLHASNHS